MAGKLPFVKPGKKDDPAKMSAIERRLAKRKEDAKKGKK